MMIGTHARRWTFVFGLFAVGAAMGCNEDGSWGDGVETETSEVVYGTDNRIEYSAAASNLRRVADSTAIVANNAALTCNTSSCSIVTGLPVDIDGGRAVIGLCPNERFGPPTSVIGQGTMLNSFCSSFLVGPDLMLTAGHCFVGAAGSLPAAQTLCANMKVVFDFKADSAGNTPVTFPASKVRSCTTVLGVADSGDDDWAVFRLDAPVTDRAPLVIRRSRKVSNRAQIALAGYPSLLPLKIASPAAVKDNTAVNSFLVNMDSFHGNSGGPVFHRDTETVEGIVQSGAIDYKFDYVTNPLGCLRVNVCSESTGCTTTPKLEMATRTKRAAAFIPSLSPRTFDSTVQPPTNGTYQTFSGDFDGDGYDDLFWYRPGTDMDYISWSNGVNKTFTETEYPTNGTYQPITGDFDGDGIGDIFWYAPGSAADFIDYGNGKARTFTSVSESVSGTYITASGDFDGDGVTDILWHAPGSDKPDFISWFVKGQRAAGLRYLDQQFAVTGTYRPVTGDFNGDGRDEIFWYRPGDASDSVWYFDANRVQRIRSSVSIGNDYQPLSGDFDGDGFADIIWYGRGSLADGITWGRANETFPIQSFPIGGTYVTATGDFNGDSATDVLWYRPGTAEDYIDWGKLKP